MTADTETIREALESAKGFLPPPLHDENVDPTHPANKIIAALAALGRVEEQQGRIEKAARTVLDYENHPSRASLSALRTALDDGDGEE